MLACRKRFSLAPGASARQGASRCGQVPDWLTGSDHDKPLSNKHLSRIQGRSNDVSRDFGSTFSPSKVLLEIVAEVLH